MANYHQRRLKYKKLIKTLRKFDVYVDTKRAKGSHRMLCKKAPDGDGLIHHPVKCHNENEEYAISVILTILDKFSIPEEEFWNK